mmetsp:Transcript_49094/g.131389  ORF Transcript_49094/g.131389 Transcript_49094/m.131389 type:complete len:294 (-) Transcript_49094:1448-2329(-)
MNRNVVLAAICASCTASSASLTHLSGSFPFSPCSAPSASRPATASSALSTFASVSFNFFSASSTSRFTASRCSTELKSFLCFATSDWAAPNRVWHLIRSELTSAVESLPFASICLVVTNFRTSMRASFASFSQALVFSLASRISSADIDMSLASSAKMLAASFTFSTRASALETRESASLTSAMRFLLFKPLFSSARRFVATSSCLWRSVSLALASAAGPAENLLTSRSFIWMCILAIEDAVCAVAAATSDSFTDASVSSTDSSTPSWGCGSPSSIFASASITAWTLLDASSR